MKDKEISTLCFAHFCCILHYLKSRIYKRFFSHIYVVLLYIEQIVSNLVLHLGCLAGKFRYLT